MSLIRSVNQGVKIKGYFAFYAVLAIMFLLVFFLYLKPVERYNRWRYGVNHGVRLEGLPVERVLEKELEELVKNLASRIETTPRNAYIDVKTGEIVPEVVGTKVHRSLTVKNVLSAHPHSLVSLVTLEVEPEITSALLNSINREMGRYHTYIGGGGGRATNVILATNLMNNVLLAPGEVFSFNKTVGPVTHERGYELAPIIVGDSIVPGVGGGICQVASTLYNAVLFAKLEVVERYPHSQPVGYVPPGRDATVSTDLDFKFRNNTDGYLLIKTSTAGYSINVRLMQR